MGSKKINVCWAISLFVVGTTTILWAGSKLIGFELTDAEMRMIGAADLLALPVLVFTTLRRGKAK